MKGLVIKNTGSWYQVKTDDGQFIEWFRIKHGATNHYRVRQSAEPARR